jgi:lipoyl(octanoyl) transferase
MTGFSDFLEFSGISMAVEIPDCAAKETTLQVYLLGSVALESLVRLQRRLHFEVTGDRQLAALIVCEHPPTITVGRHGSLGHVHLEPEELRLRGWPIRWVNRGGGCILHLPGQLALYPILPLDRRQIDIGSYLNGLGETIRDLLGDFSVHAGVRVNEHGVWVGPRLLAAIGISVRDWVSGHGAFINVHPALELFRQVTTVADAPRSMTSLERERRGPVRSSLVRERLIEHFRARFGFERVALFSDHPALHGAGQRLDSMPAPIRIAELEGA